MFSLRDIHQNYTHLKENLVTFLSLSLRSARQKKSKVILNRKKFSMYFLLKKSNLIQFQKDIFICQYLTMLLF